MIITKFANGVVRPDSHKCGEVAEGRLLDMLATAAAFGRPVIAEQRTAGSFLTGQSTAVCVFIG